MRKFKYIKSFLESSRRTDIGRDIEPSTFNDIYDSLLGEAYFKFENYEKIGLQQIFKIDYLQTFLVFNIFTNSQPVGDYSTSRKNLL